MKLPQASTIVFFIGITESLFKISFGQSPHTQSNAAGQSMLAATLEKNRELEMQNAKLRQLWAGLQQMCSALSAPKECVCPEVPQTLPVQKPTTPQQPVYTQPQPTTISPPTLPPTTTPIVTTPPAVEVQPILHMVHSSGLLQSGRINVTVEYTAPIDHTTEWLVVRENGGTIRAEGSKRPGRNRASYKSEKFISHTSITTTIIFRVHSSHDSVGVRLDPTALETRGSYAISPLNLDIMFPSDQIIAPPHENLTLTVTIHGDIASIAYSEIVLTGLNTTSNPSMVFEAFGYAGQGPDNAISIKPKSVNLTHLVIEISIRNDYSKYGGVLSAKFSSDTKGIIRGLLHGVSVHVLSSDLLATVPPDEIGVFPMRRMTVIFRPDQSLMCAAMGNPRPDVSIIKVYPDNSEAVVPAETIIRDDYTYIKTFTLTADNPRYMEGKYLCKASTETKVISTMTEVFNHQSPTFDLLETGLTKNMKQEIVITCKASGIPRPYMEVREQDEYGQALEPPQFKVVRSEPDQRTSALKLVISPGEKVVFPVYCAANQNNGQIRVYHRVDAFPKRI